jgi:hypothetical protein
VLWAQTAADPIASWVHVIVQCGSLGLLAVIVWYAPAMMKDMLAAMSMERDKDRASFSAERTLDRDARHADRAAFMTALASQHKEHMELAFGERAGFAERTSRMEVSMERQTKDMIEGMKSMCKYRNGEKA